MATILIPDMEEAVLARLHQRAAAHGRSPEAEARAILVGVLNLSTAWAGVNEFRDRLAASGRPFTDSAELLREDRERRTPSSWTPASG